MAGFVVHLAVAEEYIRKHGNIKNHNEFLLGAIKPDLYEDKKASHYGIKGIFKGMKRILRCHPFGKIGYDPVIYGGEIYEKDI